MKLNPEFPERHILNHARRSAEGGTANTIRPDAAKTGEPRQAALSPALFKDLALSLGLPRDALSSALISLAKFFSLPLDAKLLQQLRRQALSLPVPEAPSKSAGKNGSQQALSLSLSLSEAASKGAGENGPAQPEAPLAGTIRSAALAAAAAAGKGVALSPEALGSYAAALAGGLRDDADGEPGAADEPETAEGAGRDGREAPETADGMGTAGGAGRDGREPPGMADGMGTAGGAGRDGREPPGMADGMGTAGGAGRDGREAPETADGTGTAGGAGRDGREAPDSPESGIPGGPKDSPESGIPARLKDSPDSGVPGRPKNGPPSFDDPGGFVEGIEGRFPLLEVLNKLPGKDGRRWIVLPFSFESGGVAYGVSLRIALADTNSLPWKAERMALDVKTPRQRWSFMLENPADRGGRAFSRAVFGARPPLSPGAEKELRKLLGSIAGKAVLRDIAGGAFPEEEWGAGPWEP